MGPEDRAECQRGAFCSMMLSESQFWIAKEEMQSDADVMLISMVMACTLLAGIDFMSRRLYSYKSEV